MAEMIGDPMRRLIAESTGSDFRALADLGEARRHEDAWMIMQGDDGGQIYVVFPVGLVACSSAELARLLIQIDETQWRDPDSASITFERHTAGDGIAGGMGGGQCLPQGWLHPKVVEVGLRELVRATLRGT